VFRASYETAEKISIDKAVMEAAGKAGKVLVLNAPYTWDDVGSWLALERGNPQDADHNTVQALHCGVKTTNCVIVGDPDRVIGTYGVSNLLIVQDGNALLVADRKYEGEVKEIVDKLRPPAAGSTRERPRRRRTYPPRPPLPEGKGGVQTCGTGSRIRHAGGDTEVHTPFPSGRGGRGG